VNSGTETVSSGGTASNTVVSNGGSLVVASGGLADPTTISSGGSETISKGGTDLGAHVSGGTLMVRCQRCDCLCWVAGGRERRHGDQHDRVERRHGICLVWRRDHWHSP
jgi:autotransporter passenger strand-loop-strand repeat protein